MIYSKEQFVRELADVCRDSYDIVKVSRWAHGKYLANSRFMESGLEDFVMRVIAMEEGEEFEFSRDELLHQASLLLLPPQQQ